MGIWNKIVLGGATVATMATGQVQAAENTYNPDTTDSAKKETIVTPSNTQQTTSSTLDLSGEFFSMSQQMAIPSTIDELKQSLSNPTNLNREQINDVVLWRNYIISNPQDETSKEAFMVIKDATREVTNKWVKFDQYYEQVQMNGTSDDLERSKDALIKNMDLLLENENVRNSIKEANVKYCYNQATDYATLRFYEQTQLIDALEKRPEIVNEYVRLRDSGSKQDKKDAQLIEAKFYNDYGLNINNCQRGYTEVARGDVARERHLLNKEVKEQAYMYCLHRALDKEFSRMEQSWNRPDIVYVNNEAYSIPGHVALAIENYAKIIVKNAHGKKLSKEEDNILYGAPVELREARDAYFSRSTNQFTELMNRPKGEYVTFTNTQNLNDEIATQYVNLLRLGPSYTINGQNQMTSNDIGFLQSIEKSRPDLRIAKQKYEEQLAKQNGQQQQLTSNVYLAQNITR